MTDDLTQSMCSITECMAELGDHSHLSLADLAFIARQRVFPGLYDAYLISHYIVLNMNIFWVLFRCVMMCRSGSDS